MSVEGVEGAVAAVGGLELGGIGASSLVKETCKCFWKYLLTVGGWLRIAITTEISSREKLILGAVLDKMIPYHNQSTSRLFSIPQPLKWHF